jgi:hypothetical protein
MTTMARPASALPALALALSLAAAPLAAQTQAATQPAPAKGHAAEEMADMHTLEALRRNGANLSKPHKVQYFTNFPSEAQMSAARKELLAAGFTVVRAAQAGKDQPWVLILTRTMPLSTENVRASRQTVSSAVTKHGGRYDGWEAAAVP